MNTTMKQYFIQKLLSLYCNRITEINCLTNREPGNRSRFQVLPLEHSRVTPEYFVRAFFRSGAQNLTQ
jgi:hypothetical protein